MAELIFITTVTVFKDIFHAIFVVASITFMNEAFKDNVKDNFRF